MDLQCANYPESSRGFTAGRFASWRRLADDRHGAWFGAFLGGRMCAGLGLYTDGDGLARYQAVDTHPDHRRRGLAGTLVHHAGAEGLTWPGVRTLVILADPQDDANPACTARRASTAPRRRFSRCANHPVRRRNSAECRECLRQVERRAYAWRCRADRRDEIDRTIRCIARCGLGHPLQRYRHPQVDVQRRVAVHRYLPAGGPEFPRRLEVGGAVPGGAESDQLMAVAEAGDGNTLRGN